MRSTVFAGAQAITVLLGAYTLGLSGCRYQCEAGTVRDGDVCRRVHDAGTDEESGGSAAERTDGVQRTGAPSTSAGGRSAASDQPRSFAGSGGSASRSATSTAAAMNGSQPGAQSNQSNQPAVAGKGGSMDNSAGDPPATSKAAGGAPGGAAGGARPATTPPTQAGSGGAISSGAGGGRGAADPEPPAGAGGTGTSAPRAGAMTPSTAGNTAAGAMTTPPVTTPQAGSSGPATTPSGGSVALPAGDWICLQVGEVCSCIQQQGASSDQCTQPKSSCCFTLTNQATPNCACVPQDSEDCRNGGGPNAMPVAACPPP